ncbi:unnamed protein product [Prunus brigantina]
MLQLNIILSIHAGFPSSGVDKSIWRLTPNGDFSVKSAYNTFFLDEPTFKWAWEFIWQLHLPPKTKTFLWLFCHKKLLTNVQRQRRGLTQIPNCPRCAAPMETIEHLFKDCPVSIATWNGIGVDFGDLGSLDFDDWIMRNLKSRRKLSWNRPGLGGCKINSDGSQNNTTGQIGVVGVLRDATGAWLKGYYVNLGIGSVLEAEFADWVCAVRHILREQNCAADALAAISFDFSPGLHIFDEIPVCIVDILAADSRGDFRPRLLCF